MGSGHDIENYSHFGLGRKASDLSLVAPRFKGIEMHKLHHQMLYWPTGQPDDQGSFPWCTQYAMANHLRAKPESDPTLSILNNRQLHVYLKALYKRSQELDEYEGEEYDGTSILGTTRAWQEANLIGEYRWGSSLDEVLSVLDTRGTVVLGTNWYVQMFEPKGPNALISIGGQLAGGHAYIADGFNAKGKTIECFNSWGSGWGRGGHFRMAWEDFDELLSQDAEILFADHAAL